MTEQPELENENAALREQNRVLREALRALAMAVESFRLANVHYASTLVAGGPPDEALRTDVTRILRGTAAVMSDAAVAARAALDGLSPPAPAARYVPAWVPSALRWAEWSGVVKAGAFAELPPEPPAPVALELLSRHTRYDQSRERFREVWEPGAKPPQTTGKGKGKGDKKKKGRGGKTKRARE